MQDIDIWDLVDLLDNFKPISWCKKRKKDSKGSKFFKAKLVAKGFTHDDRMDFNEIFLPVCSKDSFRIIITLVTHCSSELHQMGVKIAFLNGHLF